MKRRDFLLGASAVAASAAVAPVAVAAGEWLPTAHQPRIHEPKLFRVAYRNPDPFDMVIGKNVVVSSRTLGFAADPSVTHDVDLTVYELIGPV